MRPSAQARMPIASRSVQTSEEWSAFCFCIGAPHRETPAVKGADLFIRFSFCHLLRLLLFSASICLRSSLIPVRAISCHVYIFLVFFIFFFLSGTPFVPGRVVCSAHGGSNFRPRILKKYGESLCFLPEFSGCNTVNPDRDLCFREKAYPNRRQQA